MVPSSVQSAHSDKHLSDSGSISAAGCRTELVKIRGEPMGGAIKAPMTGNGMFEQFSGWASFFFLPSTCLNILFCGMTSSV